MIFVQVSFACLLNFASIKLQSDSGTGRTLDCKLDYSHLASKDCHVDRTADKMHRDLHLDQIRIEEDNCVHNGTRVD